MRRISAILFVRAGLRFHGDIFLAIRLCTMLDVGLIALLIPFVSLMRRLGICPFGKEFLVGQGLAE